jgi:hypothetical protein
MSLLNVPAGKDLPEDIYVVIEIPANADPIKYEIDKESGTFLRCTRGGCDLYRSSGCDGLGTGIKRGERCRNPGLLARPFHRCERQISLYDHRYCRQHPRR